MQEIRNLPDRDQPTVRAVERLKLAIFSAPIEELRAPIEEELGLNEEIDSPELHETLELLKDRAMLGHGKSLETLVAIGNEIAFFLSSIVPTLEGRRGTSPTGPAPEFDESPGSWREKIDEAVDLILETKDEQGNPELPLLNDLARELPTARYSFPLRRLCGQSAPPDESLRDLADYCDRLVQQRFDQELSRAVHDLSTHSLFWPLLVTVGDYQSKKHLAEFAENLELGKAIASNLGATPRGVDTPVALVRPLFIGLEKWRKIHRSAQVMESMRLSEELNEPAPLKQLIDVARRRLRAIDQVKRKWEKLKQEGRLNNRSYLTKLFDEALAKLRETNHLEHRWERLREDGEWTEHDLLELVTKTVCLELPTHFGPWGISTLWKRKGALLPELSDDEKVINQWVEAAYAYLVAVYDGDLESQGWIKPIAKAIENSGSVDGGIKRFLRDGFETLSGKDLKS